LPTTDPKLLNARAGSNGDLLQQARQSAEMGQKDAARVLLRQAALSDPYREEIWLLAASLAATLDEAIEYVERALLINPENSRAAAWIERARKSAKPNEPAKLHELMPDRIDAIKVSQLVTTVEPLKTNHVAKPSETSRPVDPRPADKPASPVQAVGTPPAWRCPLCQQPAPAPVQRCSHCHASVALESVSSISRPENVNEQLLLEAIERCRQVLAKGPSAESHLALALAHLNLNQSSEAFPHLREACRLLPEDRQVHAAFHALRQRKLVLIADESDSVRNSIADLLESYRLRTRLAQNGFQALSMVEEEMPDLILASVSMPRMGGFDLCRALRGNISTKGIPLVLLADKAGLVEKARGHAAGVTDYATRPINSATLLRSLKKHLPESTLPDPKLASNTMLRI
jgi:CheY-like chemotaxis protein